MAPSRTSSLPSASCGTALLKSSKTCTRRARSACRAAALACDRAGVVPRKARYAPTNAAIAETKPWRTGESPAHQSIGLAKGDGLAVADEGKAADPDLALLLAGALLGQPDRGDLRGRVSAAGYSGFVQRMRVEAGDRLDADHPLVLGLMGQHRRTG